LVFILAAIKKADQLTDDVSLVVAPIQATQQRWVGKGAGQKASEVALVPIEVSERLPESDDCGWCDLLRGHMFFEIPNSLVSYPSISCLGRSFSIRSAKGIFKLRLSLLQLGSYSDLTARNR